MNPCWQKERSRLNHDWLQNGVLVALNHAERVSLGAVRTADPRGVLRRDVLRWQEHRNQFPLLMARFEREMSPVNLFLRPPLSRCSEETKLWLIPLTHECWLRRHDLPRKLAGAREAYAKAEDAYQTLMTLLESLPDSPAEDELRRLNRGIQAFRAACEQLSAALSSLPREILP